MPKTIKLHFVEKFSEGDTDRQLEAMREYFEFVSLPDCDVIYCASIVMMGQAKAAKLNTRKPLVVYCWDYYKWAHEGKNHSWNWRDYADFLRMADLVLVPSQAQQLRLEEILGIHSVVVKTGIPIYDYPVVDHNFILDPVRYYPVAQEKWAEQAAKELGIPLIHSEHQYSAEDFKGLVASCTFLTCAYEEASTGGLSLMEGLYLGKPSLVSDSPYMGARDYLGEYGTYFKWDDYEDFKSKMKDMWENRKQLNATEYMKEFEYNIMAKNLCEAIKNLKTD